MTLPTSTGFPERLISGGQTGVDRGALEAAIALGIAHGGWCPRGRLAEDGVIPSQYKLKETDSSSYAARTRKNVEDSSGTLILYHERLHGGTELTHRFAVRFAKPCLTVDLSQTPDADVVRRWIRIERLQVLNVAGPRESSLPGIALRAQRFLIDVLSPLCKSQDD